MTSSHRILINTGAQYLRTIINLALAFYSTRLILNLLGETDYGIFSLVAGVVSMLSFLTNGLVVTTQRYMSFNQEKDNLKLLQDIFVNCLFLHLVIGIFLILFLEIVGTFLFNSFLSIPEERLTATYTVYHIVITALFLSFITAPYKALTIAHENIVYSSIIDIIDGFLKVAIALFLYYISWDRLVFYALLLCCVNMLNYFAFRIYCRRCYKECIPISADKVSYKTLKSLISFTTWSVYSLGCIIGRTQGVAIIINKFYGTILNATYGIALTVNSSITFICVSICNAMNPQISKAEGRGERYQMLRLAEIESKFCTLLLSIFAIPAIIEMDCLLNIWLGSIPEYSTYFCRMILLSSIFDQLTVGLGAANQAIGNIKMYSLCINSIKLLTLPSIVIALSFGYSISIIMILYTMFELICCIGRLFFLKMSAGLSISHFITKVFLKEIFPLICILLGCWLIHTCFNFYWRFILTFLVSVAVSIPTIYYFGLCEDEKSVIDNLFYKIIKKIY